MPSVKAPNPAQKVWEVRVGKTTRYRFHTASGPKGLAMEGCKYKVQQHKFQCVLTIVQPG